MKKIPFQGGTKMTNSSFLQTFTDKTTKTMMDAAMKGLSKGAFKVETKGLEKLTFSGPTIIMPNHTSLVDVAVLADQLPDDVWFVSNTEIAKKYEWFMKGRNILTVDPMNPYSVREMVKVVNEGKPLVIFPEGRITITGGLMKIYEGTGYIAMKTGATIYPVTIDGLERSVFSYLKGKTKRSLTPKVNVLIGDPFTITKKQGVSMRIQKEQAADKILHVLQKGRFEIQQKENVNLFNELLHASQIYGEKTRISEDLSSHARYKDLILKTYVLSTKFKSLLQNESRVGVLLPSANGHVVTLFSLFRLGITPAILNFSVGKQTIQDSCETADLKTIITSKEFIRQGKLQHLIDACVEKGLRIIYMDSIKEKGKSTTMIEIDHVKHPITKKEMITGLLDYTLRKRSTATDNELVLFTSGSESKPKGVVLSHANLHANIYQARSVIDFTASDKIFNGLPMFHSFGLTAGTILPILLGVPVYLFPSPIRYKEIRELIYQKKATIMFGTSTFLGGYAKGAKALDFQSIRYAFAGAEKMRPEVANLWFEKFGIRIFEGYGITETAPILSLNTPQDYKKGSVGRLLPGIQCKVEPVEGIETGGNLFVKGPNVMKGYLLHGQGFVPAEEWYNTGDIVEIDEKGFVSITSRLKRFAKLGGEMISLNLVEQLAIDCFEFEGFAAVNIADQRKGERIVLFTTSQDSPKEKLREYIVKNGHSALLMPSEIMHLNNLPLLGSGKTDYVSLKKIVEK